MSARPAHPVECSVFVGVSLDGFMARQNGDYDFLKPFEGHEHGYKAFMAAIDTLVIGRNTYEIVLKFHEWPYPGKRSSSSARDLSRCRGTVERPSSRWLGHPKRSSPTHASG